MSWLTFRKFTSSAIKRMGQRRAKMESLFQVRDDDIRLTGGRMAQKGRVAVGKKRQSVLAWNLNLRRL